MTRERPNDLPGTTYKLRWVGDISDDAYYVTITNFEVDGKLRPYEIFFNSKDVRHYPWMVALSRMISAVFQRGENVSFVAYELQEVFDPAGSQIVGNRSFKSLLDMVGQVIERHMVSIGYIKEPRQYHMGRLPRVEKVDYSWMAKQDEGKIEEKEPPHPTSAIAIGKAAMAVSKSQDKPTPDDDFDVRGL